MARKKVRYTVSDGKLVLTLTPAEEGGFLVTSPLDPGLVTEAETLEEAFEMAYDAAAGLKAARRMARKRKSAPSEPVPVRPSAISSGHHLSPRQSSHVSGLANPNLVAERHFLPPVRRNLPELERRHDRIYPDNRYSR